MNLKQALAAITTEINSNIRDIKLLDLGSPNNSALEPVVIVTHDNKTKTFKFDPELHKQVFDAVLGSIAGKNDLLAFSPRPLVTTIIDCPMLKYEGIDLSGGFSIMIREANPYETKKQKSSSSSYSPTFHTSSTTTPSTTPPSSAPKDDLSDYMPGMKRGFLL